MNVTEIADKLVKVTRSHLNGEINIHDYVNEKVALWEEAYSLGMIKEVRELVQARLKESVE